MSNRPDEALLHAAVEMLDRDHRSSDLLRDKMVLAAALWAVRHAIVQPAEPSEPLTGNTLFEWFEERVRAVRAELRDMQANGAARYMAALKAASEAGELDQDGPAVTYPAPLPAEEALRRLRGAAMDVQMLMTLPVTMMIPGFAGMLQALHQATMTQFHGENGPEQLEQACKVAFVQWYAHPSCDGWNEGQCAAGFKAGWDAARGVQRVAPEGSA